MWFSVREAWMSVDTCLEMPGDSSCCEEAPRVRKCMVGVVCSQDRGDDAGGAGAASETVLRTEDICLAVTHVGVTLKWKGLCSAHSFTGLCSMVCCIRCFGAKGRQNIWLAGACDRGY